MNASRSPISSVRDHCRKPASQTSPSKQVEKRMGTLTFKTAWPALLAAVIGSPGILLAETVNYQIDHTKDGDLTDKLNVSPGDAIRVTITQTCPKLFDYQTKTLVDRGARSSTELQCNKESAEEKLASHNHCVLKTKTLEFTHSADTSAYLIQVTHKQDGNIPKGIAESMLADFIESECQIPGAWQGKTVSLPDRVYMLRTNSTWAVGMSGGLTVSSVTDPRFAVVNDPASMSDPSGTIVIRDPGAEDSNLLGFAGFVHVHNRNWRFKDISIAPTFGLGIGDQNSLSGFAGVALGAKDIGYVNIGWNWRQVDRLPTGQQVDAPPINENVLSDLPKRVDDGWFIGFSFRFMSPGESFFTGKTVIPEPTTNQ